MSQHDMRSTNVSWLTNLPSHWGEQAIKRLYRQAKRLGHPDGEVLSVYRDYGVILKSSRDDNANKTPEDLSVYQKVDVGDLVINKMKSWQGSLGVSNHDGITSPDYVVYSPVHSESPRFLHYLLRAEPMPAVYLSVSNGIRPSQWRLEPDKFEKLVVPLPPLSEQTQIARFLDYEAARIDALIEKQQQLTVLLKEKRQAVISHAVTKGLNPNAPLRDSGVEWLGMVPAHWEVLSTSRISDLTTGGRDTQDAREDGPYPFFVRSQTVERIDTYAFDGEGVLTSGDGAGVGKIYHHFIGKLEFHQRVYLFFNFRRVLGRFFFFFLREHLAIVALAGNAKSTVDSLRRPMLRSFPVAVPPVAEQREIVAYLERHIAKIDGVIDKAVDMIPVLQERRTALISAAVTGKIDVRNWTPPESKPERDVA